MEKKITNNTIAALDSLLKLRIIISFLTSSAGICVATLGSKAHEVLKQDRDRVSDLPSGVELDVKTLLNLTQTSLVIGSNLAVGTLCMIIFLARRWHHPSPKKQSLLQKIRPIMKMILDAEFFIFAIMFALMLTLKSNTDVTIRGNPQDISTIGVPERYIKNHYFWGLIVSAWLFAIGYLLGVVLEASSFMRYRRIQKVAFIEK